QAGELDLLRAIAVDKMFYKPVVQRPMVLELERAQRMRDPLDRIGGRMREIVHRINAPRVTSEVVRCVANPIKRRYTHVQVRRGHIDLRAKDVGPILEAA